jgi:hypothetical protein
MSRLILSRDVSSKNLAIELELINQIELHVNSCLMSLWNFGFLTI